MAKSDISLGAPAVDVGTELYYSTSKGTGLKQIFGLQGVPVISAAKESITWRTLESDEEFSSKGRRPSETIEVNLVSQRKQHDELKALSDADTMLWWYLKLPSSYTAEGVSGDKVVEWQGSIDLTFGEISLDSTIQDVLTIGKSTIPEELDGLPSSATV